MRAPADIAREAVGADALAGIGYQRYLPYAERAAEIAQREMPQVVDHDKSLLFLAEVWFTVEQGDLKLTVWRTAGTLAEAEIHRGESKILSERIDLRPTVTAWATDLLTRAQKGSS